jgi:pilus assembly protein CpaC
MIATHRCLRRPTLLGAAFALGLALLGGPAPVFAQDGAGVVVEPTTPLVLEVRKGRVIRLDRPAAAVFVADPDTADVQVHSPSLVYVLGRRAGRTSLYAVDADDEILLRRDVIVEHNLSGLRAVLREIAADQPIEVSSIDGAIVLAGTVADPKVAQDLRETAARFLGQDEAIVNRMTVSAPTQVSLRVRVAEVSREVTKLFGVNLDALLTPGDFVFSLASGRPFLGPGGGVIPLLDADGAANNVLGGYSNGSANINGLIDALEREGLVNVLAEPNLTALSGETASFLAGGEFPIPVGTDDNDITIEFKQFGVSLAFTPTVLSPGRISLRVRPEVSDITDRGAIRVNNLVIPALTTRRAETTVELGSGQSFAIGGLISNATRSNVEKFPGLGDLPILGTLFRSTSFKRSESELVIIVTPYLVRPVSEPVLASPNDGLREASDLERILRGRLVRPELPGARQAAAALRLVGPAGFALD